MTCCELVDRLFSQIANVSILIIFINVAGDPLDISRGGSRIFARVFLEDLAIRALMEDFFK